MLNQPSIFEAANIEHTEIHGLAASHLLTSRSHADPILSDKLKPRAVCHDAREASSRVPRNWWRINRLAPGLDSLTPNIQPCFARGRDPSEANLNGITCEPRFQSEKNSEV
jgi:hypothetical protein